MTLILGMSKPEGLYLSVDYRLSRAGTRVSDNATKFLQVDFQPLGGGPQALMGYCGVAFAPDGTPTGQWIRETLRGETNEYSDDSMRHLRSRLDRDFRRLRQPLIINMFVMHQGKRFFGGLSNWQTTGIAAPRFEYMLRELSEWYGFVNGSGGPTFRAEGQRERLQRLTHVVPRSPVDHMKLLAVVNRKVAAKDKTVSPFCQVTFRNADGRFKPMSSAFTQDGEVVPLEMPVLIGPLDLTDSISNMGEWAEATRDGRARPAIQPARVDRRR